MLRDGKCLQNSTDKFEPEKLAKKYVQCFFLNHAKTGHENNLLKLSFLN